MAKQATTQTAQDVEKVEKMILDTPGLVDLGEYTKEDRLAYEAEQAGLVATAQKIANGKGKSFADELAEEAEQDAPKMDGTRVAQPPDVWTLERLEDKAPITADLYGDGLFLFDFLPIFYKPAIQKRFRLGKKVDEKSGEGLYEMYEGWAEIIAMTVVKWPLRETVLDDDEEPVYETIEYTDPDTGKTATIRQQKTIPLAIKRKNVEKLDPSFVALMLNAMQATLTGEAKG